jgi:CheY-like chemotaxis protein
LIGEADGCLSAQTMSQTLKPDIILIAAGLPEKEVTMLLQGFHQYGRYKPYTIVFANTASQKRKAISAGADAVLWRSDSTLQLTDALNRFQATIASQTTN